MSAIDIQLQPTLKMLREKHELTQEAAARLVRVTPRSWARYESGDSVPAEGVLELFCMKLGEKYPQAFAIQLYNMHLAEAFKMKTVIVQKDSGLIVEDQHGMLCVFINRDKAVSFMENRLHDLPAGLEIVDCSIVKR